MLALLAKVSANVACRRKTGVCMNLRRQVAKDQTMYAYRNVSQFPSRTPRVASIITQSNIHCF